MIHEEFVRVCGAIDGAKYVEADEKAGLIFVWDGGHGINVYNSVMEEIHYFNVGDFKNDEATLKEVKEGIKDEKEAMKNEI